MGHMTESVWGPGGAENEYARQVGGAVVMGRPRSRGKVVMDRQGGEHRPDSLGRTQGWETN